MFGDLQKDEMSHLLPGIVYYNKSLLFLKNMSIKIFSMHQKKDEALKLYLEIPCRRFTAFTYFDYVKCVHDLLVQQEYLQNTHSFAFVWFKEEALTCSKDNVFFLNQSRYLYPINNNSIAVNYKSFVTDFDSVWFPHIPINVSRHVFEYSIAKWIVKKAGHAFKHTKLGYFICRSLNKKKPIFI
jgi:hypothetical protein